MLVQVAWLAARNRDSFGSDKVALRELKVSQYLAMPAETAPPIVIETNGKIFDGKHRFHVAKLRGLTEVECIYRNGAAKGNS